MMRKALLSLCVLSAFSTARAQVPQDTLRLDTLVTVRPKVWNAVGSVFGINAAVLAYDSFLFNRNWAMISDHSIHTNLTDGWVWDADSYSGNQFSHPFHGSMFFNSARENGIGYGYSMLFPLLGSWSWEIFCENNRPAINDLFATGVGGSAIGEATHRISDLIFDDTKTGGRRVFREMAGSLLNPVRGMKRLLSGEMFHATPGYQGKHEPDTNYEFEAGLGVRYIEELNRHRRAVARNSYTLPVIDFVLNYGDRFNALDGGRTVPFDHFELEAMMNLSSTNPTFGYLDISGRIFSHQQTARHHWDLDWAVYQNFKYVDHYSKQSSQHPGNLPLISESASFGAGLTARHGEKQVFQNHLQVNLVPMGASTADYSTERRYNFGAGYSLREEVKLDLNHRFTLGDKLYYMELFTLTGLNPTESRTRHNGVMGDKGKQRILTNTVYGKWALTDNLMLKLEYRYYYRKGIWDYFPNTHAKSQEGMIVLSYTI